MSSTIKSKFEHQLQRQVSQHTAERKNELSSRHLNELKNLGQSIKKSNEDKRILRNAAHAVNHIKAENKETTETTQVDPPRIYNRQAKIKNLEEDNDSSKMEKAQSRISQPTDEKNAQTEDDFYQAKDRGNILTEDSNGYYIEAFAPEHEKAGLRVSISHDKAVISGSRKAENTDANANRKITTNNFQSFSEEFALGTPVLSQGITRERDGDFIRFFIPKLNSNNKPNES